MQMFMVERCILEKMTTGVLFDSVIKTGKKLLDAIMGIVADINLLYENDLHYIEIIMDNYFSLIGYHGKPFIGSGSIMRTITKKELDKAILKSQGKACDDIPISDLKVGDL